LGVRVPPAVPLEKKIEVELNMNWFSKIRNFFHEVWEEFLKCTRPTFQELKESTVIIVVTMAILGVLIAGSDFVIRQIMGFIF
jgi:preprotein translocase SecE subunit